MKQIPVGRSGVTISAIGLGGAWGREIDEESSQKVLDHAFENGFRFFDTAEGPDKGSMESILGRWMHSRGVRDQITLSTKISQPVNAQERRKAGAKGHKQQLPPVAHDPGLRIRPRHLPSRRRRVPLNRGGFWPWAR